MKKNWGSKRALAVILCASLAFSPTITAAAANPTGTLETEDSGKSDNSENLDDTVSETESETKSGSESESESETDTSASEEGKETKSKTVGKTETKESDEVSENEDSSDDKDSDIPEDSNETESSEEEKEDTLNEDLPLYELVDPDEEGLDSTISSINVDAATDIPVEEYDPDELIRVIVVLDGDSVLDKGYDTENLAENRSAISLSESIIEDQSQTVEKISDEALEGESLDVNYNFSIIANAISADVPFKYIESIEKIDGVKAVYIASLYEPTVNTADPNTLTAGDMVGSYSTWATGYTGAGTRIAVIDTGIDSDHPSFDGGAFDAHLKETAESAGKSVADYSLLAKDEISEVLPLLNAYQRNSGINADSLYLSEKIPFAFNYVDSDLDVTHDNDDEGDHGTHVSGIATANTYVPGSDGYKAQANGVVGIAPDAQLITMKVFGKNGGAYSDDYMAAIEDAILLNADVVNLSLGSSAAGYSSDSESYINGIFDKLNGSGTVVSISAGNSGRWADDSMYGVNLSGDVNQDTVGSPGSYTNAFTVASAVNSGYTGNYFSVGDLNVFYSNGSDTLAPAFESLDTSSDKSGTDYPYVFLDAFGEEEDYRGVDVRGKIVFVSRGAITFGQKQMNAEAAGAKACIIYNNTSGTLNMTLQGSTGVIPCVSITLSDGIAIMEGSNEISTGVYEGTLRASAGVTTNYNAADGYTMSTFSSFGVPGSLDLKPEITAPGGNIYSSIDGGYGNMSGTSMAAPSIAGQTALVEQYIKENNLQEKTGLSTRTLAQSLIMSTAIPLHEDNDAEVPEYTPRSQGAGLANVYNAVSTPAYILVGDKNGNDGKVKAVLGDDPEKSGNYSFSFDIYNLSDEAQYYVLDSSVLTEELYDGGWTKYFGGDSHRLSPYVSLTSSNSKLVYDLNGDGVVNLNDRNVFLQVVNKSVDLPIVDQKEDYFDFNKDGVVDTKDVYSFGRQINGGEAVADLSMSVVEVTDTTRIDVNIDLSESDRDYLSGFENGIYVDGYIYVNGDVPLSVPFLAFYGSWMDSNMFEDFDFMRYIHDDEYDPLTYTGISRTNFLSIYPLEEWEEYYYIPNFFADDDEYIPDRNALSSENGSCLGSQYYTLIRNASRVNIKIKDRDNGKVYYDYTEYENYAAFVHEGSWQNTLQWQDLFWTGIDEEEKPLPDGTRVDVILEAVPSYYDDVEDPSTLNGEGLYLSTPIVIDNTDPVITDAVKNENGGYDITLYDNRYTAAAVVIGSDKKTLLGRYAINQQNAEEDVTISIDAPDDVFYVEVYDYALNSSVYRFNNTGHADTKYVSEISVDKDEVTLRVGQSTSVEVTVSPKWLAEGYDRVEWMSSDESVATVSQNGVITAEATGNAIITVATLATDKKGYHLTATVEVTVVSRNGKNETLEDQNETELTEDESSENDDREEFVDIDDEENDDLDKAGEAQPLDDSEDEKISDGKKGSSDDNESDKDKTDDESDGESDDDKEAKKSSSDENLDSASEDVEGGADE